ncbi:MAG: DUF169 domain-containing protein [bacterium]|nr:DUF169 domain-containing protein [bacterium]
MKKENIKKFGSLAGIENIISVYFCDDFKFKAKCFQDTICTAVARVFLNHETIIFSKEHKQLCPGADYFLKLSKISISEAIKNYVKDEHVFCNEKVCRNFLKHLPKFPKELKHKNIVMKPFEFKDNPQIIVMLLTPALAGRVLGLLNYDKYENVVLNPSQPTCISLFSPIVTEKPHINFIDYYDRYYQNKFNGKSIWSEGKLIISLKYNDFIVILNNFSKSSHGSYNPNISVQKVDPIK